MRAYLALAVACVFIVGCGGTASVPPARSNDNLSATSTNTATATQQLLVGTFNFTAWYDQSPLALLGRGAYGRSTPNDIRFASTPTFNRVYVAFPQPTNDVNNDVLEFDGTTHAVRRVMPVGPYGTNAIAVMPDDSRLYIGVDTLNVPSTLNTVHVVDVATGKLLTRVPLPIRSGHIWMAADPSGAHVYVLTPNEFGPGVLTQIDTATNTLGYNSARFPSGLSMESFGDELTVTSDDRTVNFASVVIGGHGNADTVFAVDAASGSIIATIATLSGTEYFPALVDSKTTSALYVVKSVSPQRTGSLPVISLLTLNPRTLAAERQVPLSGIRQVMSIAAASSGHVFLNAQLLSKAWVIEAVDPTSGKVLTSIAAPQAVNIYAQ